MNDEIHAISDDASALICEQIQQIERNEDFRVLFAVESGSRAWGFASQDSDYDVRFVYKRPLYDYLRLDGRKETFDWHQKPLYDVSGWDVSKYLGLLARSNPSALEWLQCPRYVVSDPLRFGSLEELASRCFNARKLAFHYLGMARENANEFLRISNGVVRDEPPKTKKYVYVVRAMLSARYVCDCAEMPPVELDSLLDCYGVQLGNAGVMASMADLVARKRDGLECDVCERIPEIDRWFVANYDWFAEKAAALDGHDVPWDDVNEMMLRMVTT